MKTQTDLTKDLMNHIDYAQLSKKCRTQEDLASMTKMFMKNMIENMLKAELKSI